MIEVYFRPNDFSTNKVKNFLKEKTYKLININNISEAQIKKLFYYSTNTNELISFRSKIMKQNKDLFNEEVKFENLIKLILNFPSILKAPIILDEKNNHFQVGYNAEDIEIFLRGN